MVKVRTFFVLVALLMGLQSTILADDNDNKSVIKQTKDTVKETKDTVEETKDTIKDIKDTIGSFKSLFN
jgi:septal ring factor EnvC (AmiA/AmiB activator)